jgi:hypothetical protein
VGGGGVKSRRIEACAPERKLVCPSDMQTDRSEICLKVLVSKSAVLTDNVKTMSKYAAPILFT